MAAPTARPWRVHHEGEQVWIEGPEGSGNLGTKDRRIICDFRIYGDVDLDAETEANFNLIVETVNGLEDS